MIDRALLESRASRIAPEVTAGVRVLLQDDISDTARWELRRNGVMGCTACALASQLGAAPDGRPALFVDASRMQDDGCGAREIWQAVVHEAAHILAREPPYDFGPREHFTYASEQKAHGAKWMLTTLALAERSRRLGFGSFSPGVMIGSYLRTGELAEQFADAVAALIADNIGDIELIKAGHKRSLPMLHDRPCSDDDADEPDFALAALDAAACPDGHVLHVSLDGRQRHLAPPLNRERPREQKQQVHRNPAGMALAAWLAMHGIT